MEVVVGDVSKTDFTQRDIAGILVQYPDTFGNVKDYNSLADDAHANGVNTYYHFISHFIGVQYDFNGHLFHFRL